MYEPHYEEGSTGSGFMMGFLCGAALGAAIALMFAPKAGSEMRRTLADSTDQLRRKAVDTYGQYSGTVSEMVSKGKEAVDRGREAFDRARELATERGKETVDKTKQAANEYATGPRGTETRQ